MATASKPSKLTIRAYHVGFGDCFLLTFQYPAKKKHVLIDFGTTGTPSHNDKTLLSQVADLIVKHCTDSKGIAKLDAVVLTHRPRDHIRGFSTEASDGNGGTRIAALKPDLVVEPWTEDPKAAKDSKGPGKAARGGTKSFSASDRAYVSMLRNMNRFAFSINAGQS
jgi:glyoxylase-like metal-dependent hydrolase (beta-lactamase superfamily II)